MEYPRSLRGIVSDFDGTLFDLNTDYAALRAELNALLAPIDCTKEPVNDWLPRLNAIQRAQALAVIARRELDGVRTGQWIDGAHALVAAARARGLAFAVVTRNCRATVEAAFAAAALPSPDALVGLDDDVALKPHPDSLGRALSRMQLSAADCIMLGDTHHDMEVAAHWNMYRVLRFNPRLPHAPIEMADRVIHSLGELHDQLSR